MKIDAFDKVNIGGAWITGVEDDLSSNSVEKLIHVQGIKAALDALTLSGSNTGEVYNVKAYGGVANAVIPANALSSGGDFVTGTNNFTAIQAAINAAPAFGMVLIGAGNWYVGSPLVITSKPLYIVILGNIYTNGGVFLQFNAPGGADRQHKVIALGTIYGRANLISHTKTRWQAGTGPAFNTFTGAAISIGNNVNSMHCLLNKVEGYAAGIDIVVGGGNGSQENSFGVQKLNNNRYGIRMRSTDGLSWCDKTILTGWDGGSCRITGDVALKIDGYSGTASNGEQYNGAFRSNEFEFLAEAVTRVSEIDADCTEPRIDVTVEGGADGGVFDADNAFVNRSIVPNYVRAPKYEGQGVLGTNWLQTGLGVDGTINMPIWRGPGSLFYIGNTAVIDSAGKVNVNVRHTLTKANRDDLATNQPNIRCVNLPIPKSFRTITATTGSNTSTDAGGVIKLNSNPMNFTATGANTNVGVRFTLMNINAATATITNVQNLTSLASGKSVDIECDGVNFMAIINP